MKGTVGIIGLGLMGYNMGVNLIKRGYTVYGYDIYEPSCTRFAEAGGIVVDSEASLGRVADRVIITAKPVQPFTTNKESVGQHPFRFAAQRPLTQVFALAQPTFASQSSDLLFLFFRYADLDPRTAVFIVGEYRLLSKMVFQARSAPSRGLGGCAPYAGKPGTQSERDPRLSTFVHTNVLLANLRDRKKSLRHWDPPSAHRRR